MLYEVGQTLGCSGKQGVKSPGKMLWQVLGPSVLSLFKHHLLKAMEQQFPNVRGQAGEAEGWLG